MGGWYGADGFVPGHSLGQYISGLARLGRDHRRYRPATKVGELVDGFAATLGRQSNAYAGPGAQTLCGLPTSSTSTSSGCSTPATLSGVEARPLSMPGVSRAPCPCISPVGHDRVGDKTPPYDETYVLPENLFAAARLTGDPRIAELAVKYLLDAPYFDPLARGDDVLPGRHAYSHVMALNSAAEPMSSWVIRDTARQPRTAGNSSTDATATPPAAGDPNETLVRTAPGQLCRQPHHHRRPFRDTLWRYAAMKLARYLLRFTGDARYGDDLERVLYNSLLGSQAAGLRRRLTRTTPPITRAPPRSSIPKKWPCCSGTLVQGVADYVRNVYFRRQARSTSISIRHRASVVTSADGRSSGAGNRLSRGRAGHLAVSTPMSPDAVRDHAPRPRLACAGPARSASTDGAWRGADAGAFAALRRTWRSGDVSSCGCRKRSARSRSTATHPDTVALMRGPLLYVRARLRRRARREAPPRQASTPLRTLSGAPLRRWRVSVQSYVQSERRAADPVRAVPRCGERVLRCLLPADLTGAARVTARYWIETRASLCGKPRPPWPASSPPAPSFGCRARPDELRERFAARASNRSSSWTGDQRPRCPAPGRPSAPPGRSAARRK